METIPNSYKQAGHLMELSRRERNAVIYKAISTDYWEVHQIRVDKPRKIFGKDYPEREILAGNEDFGTYAWACTSLEAAEARLDNILATYWASMESRLRPKPEDSDRE